MSGHARALHGEIGWEIEADSQSQQGTAMTTIMLHGAGVALGGCGFIAAHLWRLPTGWSIVIVLLAFFLPTLTYAILRRSKLILPLKLAA